MSGPDGGHARWSEDVAAYALGALEPGEAAALESHLGGCERCREDLRWLQPAVRTLPEAVEQRQPPPALRESLMAEVRAEARGGAAARSERRRQPRWRFAAGFAALALLIAVAAGYEIGKDGSQSETSTVVSRQADGIEVKMVQEGKKATLELAGVQQLAPNQVLEAWVRREGTVEPVPALFVPDSAGNASTTIADISGVDTVMVTREPQGGSREPTTEPIVTMSVPQ